MFSHRCFNNKAEFTEPKFLDKFLPYKIVKWLFLMINHCFKLRKQKIFLWYNYFCQERQLKIFMITNSKCHASRALLFTHIRRCRSSQTQARFRICLCRIPVGIFFYFAHFLSVARDEFCQNLKKFYDRNLWFAFYQFWCVIALSLLNLEKYWKNSLKGKNMLSFDCKMTNKVKRRLRKRRLQYMKGF